MTASLQTKKDRPYYYVVLAYKDEITGKNKTKWISTDIPIKGNNKRLANEKMKEVLAEYESSGVDLGKDMLFVDFLKEWLETMKGKIQITTYDAYELTLSKHIIPYFDSKKLRVRDITPAHIQAYCNLKLKTLSVNTITKHMANISKCLESAVRQNLILFNPAKRVELPQKERFIGAKVYNEKQIFQLLNCSKNDPLEIVILFTLFYGLRRSEVLGLKWNAIDFEINTITINHTVVRVNGKTHRKDSTKNISSYRTAPLPDILKYKLKKLKAQQIQDKLLQPNNYVNDGYIFVDAQGNLFHTDYVTKHFKLILKKNELDEIRFHDLRHSSATYLRSLGFSMKEIQDWLGHSDISTTMNIYTHLDIEDKRIIADRLNEKLISFGV